MANVARTYALLTALLVVSPGMADLPQQPEATEGVALVEDFAPYLQLVLSVGQCE